MPKQLLLVPCVLAMFMVGCSTGPRETSQKHPSNWQDAPEASVPLPPTHIPQTETPLTPPTPPAPEQTWIPLAQWGAQHGFNAPRLLSSSPARVYALSETGAVLVVATGSRSAYWNGMDIRLGFAPRLINGEPNIHSLDIRKNFNPLLREFQLTTRPDRLIVIDAGHGGGNSGTKSIYDDRFEKEFTLDWALRLAPLLEKGGWRVLLTRTNDVEMTLLDRVTFAETNKADLFISLHFNSARPDTEPAGLETYCLTPTGMPSNLIREFEDNVTQVFPNNAFDEQNLQFAARLHRALLTINGNADRGVCRARFPGILRGQRRPSVLLEAGYLSNHQEAEKVADPAYRQQLAAAVAAALAIPETPSTDSQP